MRWRHRTWLGCLLLGLCLSSAWAQGGKAAPPRETDSSDLPEAPSNTTGRSRVDIFGGYSFTFVNAHVFGNQAYEIHGGPIGSASAYFTRNLGLTVEGAYHLHSPTNCLITAQAGPIYRFKPASSFSTFLHVTGGGAKTGIQDLQGCVWGYGFTAGGGFDYIPSAFDRSLAIRLLQVDYEYMHINYTIPTSTGTQSGGLNVNVPRISGGLVLRFGDIAPILPKSFQCNASPAEVYTGENVVVAAIPDGYDLRRHYTFRWELSGGTVVSPGPDTFVDTAGLSPGKYSATAHMLDKHGSKELAQCSASFTVKASPAPSVQCTATPQSVEAGGSVSIFADAKSLPQRRLRYSISASAGLIGRRARERAELSTEGAAPGTITIRCAVEDDLGHSAEDSTTVTVMASPAPPQPPPPPPPVPHMEKLCSISFERSRRNPSRLDEDAKACLDTVAGRLKQDPETRLALIGNHSAGEPDGARLSAERAVHARDYLVIEKRIDPARIDLRTGSDTAKSAESYLLFKGAIYDLPPTEQLDEPGTNQP